MDGNVFTGLVCVPLVEMGGFVQLTSPHKIYILVAKSDDKKIKVKVQVTDFRQHTDGNGLN